MTVQAPPGAARLSGPPISQDNEAWPPRTADGRSGELPSAIGGWSLTPIAAGWWLSDAGREAPAAARSLSAEPGRPSVIIDADGPDARTDQLLGQLLPVLSSAGLTTLRLVLSAAGERYAAQAARTHGIDLIVAEDAVVITPHGYALVRSAKPMANGVLPQWRRCLPGGDILAAGALAPSPAWERGLATDLAADLSPHATLRRVPAGLALARPGQEAKFFWAAQEVWPDPERLSIVIEATAPHEEIQDLLTEVLARLSPAATDGIRLHWPRAGAGGTGALLAELATRFDVDLIAPTVGVSPSGFGGTCHGPVGAAPWLQFGRDGNVSVLGSLYPVPAWERALAGSDLPGSLTELACEHIAAGLCLYRPDLSQRGLAATGRSLRPDPAQATIVVGGDVQAEAVRRDVEAVLSRLPAAAGRKLRLVLAGAASGGEDSYAQFLADAFGSNIVAPVGRWTATPDGRLRALPAAGDTSGPDADSWRMFSPRSAPAAQSPGTAAAASPPPPQRSQPEDSGPAGPEPAGPEPAGPEPAFMLLARDHRSTAQERLAYRESATRYQTFSVSVRRVLTQQPGLRAVAAGDAEDSVITDFTAVLDFLADDRQAVAATLRSTGTAGNPRVACVLSGLRRLPSFTGAVFSSATKLCAAASGYVVGSVLVEPAFVGASSSRLAAVNGDIQYVIWSQTGRRVAALAAEADRDDIIFAAGTAYRVLQVDLAGSGTSQRVFLREFAILRRSATAGQTAPEVLDGQLDETDRRVLERLITAAGLRDGAAAEDQAPARRIGTALPIGLDTRGIPIAAVPVSR